MAEGYIVRRGSSSDTKVDTCTVTITSFNEIKLISYTYYQNGHFYTGCVYNTSHVTLENVVCQSCISVHNDYQYNGFTHSHDSRCEDVTNGYFDVLMAPKTPGVTATINIYDNYY